MVEAETRLTDIQALLRRIELRRVAEPGIRIILLVNDTAANRGAIKAAAAILASTFPVPTRSALRALSAGRVPDADALVLL